MKSLAPAKKRRSVLLGVLAAVCLAGCFILAPLGSFAVWILAGAASYALFLAVWFRVPPPARPSVRKKSNAKQAELDAYIRFHLRVLAMMFLAAIFFVLVLLLFLT